MKVILTVKSIPGAASLFFSARPTEYAIHITVQIDPKNTHESQRLCDYQRHQLSTMFGKNLEHIRKKVGHFHAQTNYTFINDKQETYNQVSTGIILPSKLYKIQSQQTASAYKIRTLLVGHFKKHFGEADAAPEISDQLETPVSFELDDARYSLEDYKVDYLHFLGVITTELKQDFDARFPEAQSHPSAAGRAVGLASK